jgi:uncharacterized membrane protein
LFAGWLLCLALLPLRIATVYGGLPAHPLFLHVPVVLIPIVALASLVFVLVPDRWVHLGTRLTLAAVLTLAATVLTVDAGFALRARVDQQSQGLPLPASFAPGGLVARHAASARIVELLMFAWTLGLVALIGAGSGRPGSGALWKRMPFPVLRLATAGLAVACVVFVVRTGDLGARAVWSRSGQQLVPSQNGVGPGSAPGTRLRSRPTGPGERRPRSFPSRSSP